MFEIRYRKHGHKNWFVKTRASEKAGNRLCKKLSANWKVSTVRMKEVGYNPQNIDGVPDDQGGLPLEVAEDMQRIEDEEWDTDEK